MRLRPSDRSRQLGDMIALRGISGTPKAVKGHGNGPLTGHPVHVTRGPWAGLDGVVGPKYMQAGRYWLRLEDGFTGVLPSAEIEVL